MEICKRPFDNPDLFESLWQEVALRVYYHHGARNIGFSTSSQGRRSQIRTGLAMLKGALLKRVSPPDPGQDDYLRWYHMVACESHRQMLATALGVLAGEIVDLRSAETNRLADEMMPWSEGTIQA